MTTTALQTWLRTRAESDRHAAFEAIVSAWGAAIRRTCRGFERAEARQDELVQEVLMNIWRALPGLVSPESARSWVLRIAHNTALKHVRHHAPRRRMESEVDVESVVHGLQEVVVDRARKRARLHAAIQQLPPADRSLVLLWLEGLDHHELADVSGLSPTNVRTRLSRLRARLTRALGGTP